MMNRSLLICSLLLSITAIQSSVALADDLVCFDASKGETIEDCPWAAASRAIDGIRDPAQIRKIIDENIPGFLMQVDQDAQARELLNLWGLSRNIDESNLSTQLKTVPANFIEFLAQLWQVPYNSAFTEGHAGLTHTYGYLFSNLTTPYGFKRARYTREEVDQGFGLPYRTLSGHPMRGTLFANLTHFAGTIAFRDNATALAELNQALESPAVTKVLALNKFNYAELKPKRLVEIVDNRKFHLEIHTDIVNFTHKNTHGLNTALLIYSIDFRSPDQPTRPRLITAFPVDAKFATGLFNPAILGDKVQLSLKYNAVLPVSVPAEELVGRRFIQNESN